MARQTKHPGIREVRAGEFLIQAQVSGLRRTRRLKGSTLDAKVAHGQMLAELLEENEGRISGRSSMRGCPGPLGGSKETLADWLTGRYAEHQLLAQNERTRRKLVAPKLYLLASDLADVSLSALGTAEVNRYIEWRLKVGALTFAHRKDGQRCRARTERVGNQTVNKSLKLLSSALHLALDEGLLSKLPKINFLPEDDGRTLQPPSEESYRALIAGAQALRASAPLLPEVVELLGECGLRPGELFHLTWGSVDWNLDGDNHGVIRVEEQKRTRVVGSERWVPKNKKHRDVPFTPRAREVLERLHAQAKPKPSDFVIPNADGRPYIRLDSFSLRGGGTGAWKQLRKLTGVEGVSMRDLRHFFAVQNLLRGVPITVVSAWMGHSSIELTVKRYGRWAHESREHLRWADLRAKTISDVAGEQRKLKLVP